MYPLPLTFLESGLNFRVIDELVRGVAKEAGGEVAQDFEVIQSLGREVVKAL